MEERIMRDVTQGSPTEAGMPRPGWSARISTLVRNHAIYVLVSLLLLLPVFWQPRVQAGDLSSHIYNAWLAQLIETGKAQGLVLVSQTTNILFDLILSALFQVGGAEFAQRISVSLAVLTFVWGAFAFVSVVSGRKPWHLMPSIAMLAYGWVFHMGFFNFYLSLGLCFWALSMAWELKLRRMAIAAPLLALAYAAHALPVVWTAGLLLYLWLASRISPRKRVYLTTAWLMAMVALNVVVGRTVFSRWSLQQIKMTTGADQVWVFDDKYYVVLAGLLLVWGLMFIRLLRKSGMERVVSSIPFQFCVISAAAVFILPTTILIPGFHHNLVYIAERMSLGVGVCVCALLGAAAPRVFERYALLVVAIVFFGFLYRDERILNSFEDQMSDTVAQLAPWQRIVSGVDDPDLHVNALTHMIDRVCLGRCFSFANYEPSTAQFRIRAVAGNPYVAATYLDSWRMQTGTYVVKPQDLPLYQVDLDQSGNLAIRALEAGKPCGSTPRKALPSLAPWSQL
jgi:hypothetical protein